MSYTIRKNVKKSLEIVNRDQKVIAPCQHLSYYPLVVDSGKNAMLKDVDGNEYIDFLSSASSLNLGSTSDVTRDAIEKQLAKTSQYIGGYSYSEETVSYAEKLCSVYPGGVKAKVAFGNCGSDGNDAAVKFSRAYTGRPGVITFVNGYYGNTYGSSTMTACTTRMHAKMGPFLPEVYHFPFFGEDVPDDVVEKEGTREMEQAFQSYLPADEAACMVIEPIQGDGGILPAHPLFMKKLYNLCKKYGILFISEEVQQGFYRAGHFFSIENYPGIIPDGIVMGKSLGAGLTLGAFMGRAEIMDCLPAPAHVFTLGGNALACAAGNAAFDYYMSDEFQNHYRKITAAMKSELDNLKKKHPDTVAFYRGRGMSWGVGIQKKENGKYVPDGEGTFKTAFRSYEKGLVIITLGENILRVQPPLTISEETLHQGFVYLDESLTELEQGKLPDDMLSYRHGW